MSLGKIGQHFPAQIRMRDFPAPEENHRLDLVPLFEETQRVVLLEVVVVIVSVRTEFHFLHFHPMLLLLCLVLLLFLLIGVLPVVHDLTNGGISSGRNKNEIEAQLFGFLHADVSREDLRDAIREYDAYLSRPDELIDVVFPGAPERSKRPAENNKSPFVVQPYVPA